MAKVHKVRDPVHDFVHLSGKELRLVDTPVFQRLRGIRQLAMADLVYPGALHTRFDHSLGVCHVAGLMAEELGIEGGDLELVRLAALLHDLGHGPFSHVSENSLQRFTDPARLKSGQSKDKIHELITAQVIHHDKDVQDLLGGETCRLVTKLLADGYGDPVLKSIVSGPLDADKQDYLLRDSRYAGVRYGLYDIHQLHRSLKVGDGDGGRELRIAADGVPAVEQFVMAKYYMFANVYRHKVRLVTDQMISRAIALGVESDRIDDLNAIYRYDGTDNFVANYMRWDDARFLVEFGGQRYDGKLCHQLVRRLRERRLFKRVFREPVRLLPEVAREPVAEMFSSSSLDHAAVLRVEAALAEAINEVIKDAMAQVDPRFVIAHSYTVKLDSKTAKNDGANILVESRPTAREFETMSPLFQAISKGFNERYFEVYAPVAWPDPAKKKPLLAELDGKIRDRLGPV
ncbi:MAG: HD domain-containing protein [Gemmataceae bacterium]|nr:HD domain-containing protein [Gemmataceae bacterium]